jgi:L-ascorbate metabolism protein UlaG (beta-lactamase superfamily)
VDATRQHSIQFIGNATTLIRVAGLTILTDPTFVHAGEAVPIGYGMTTRRLKDPAIEFDDLPPLDLVLLSHFHGDHFDRIAEERLDRNLPIVTTPEAAGTLQGLGFRAARGLDPWERHEPGGGTGTVRITALPARHAPSVLAVALPDVMGSLLEVWSDGSDREKPDLSIYISGDTIVFDGLRDIAIRHPRPDVGVFHLGGTRVMGVTVTLDAEQGTEAVRIIQPDLVLPIHYDDYDAFESPLSDFLECMQLAGYDGRVQVIERGATLDL